MIIQPDLLSCFQKDCLKLKKVSIKTCISSREAPQFKGFLNDWLINSNYFN